MAIPSEGRDRDVSCANVISYPEEGCDKDEPVVIPASADDEGEWEYVYEDELEEGDVWEYLDEDDVIPELRQKDSGSYEMVQDATDALNSVFREGVAAACEVKDAIDDIRGAFDLKGLFKL